MQVDFKQFSGKIGIEFEKDWNIILKKIRTEFEQNYNEKLTIKSAPLNMFLSHLVNSCIFFSIRSAKSR